MIPEKLRREAEACLARWGAAVDPAAWGLLDKYLGDVLEYNRKTNLTAASSVEELLFRHALDGWAALRPLRERLPPAPRIADVGTGAGFIGVSLKLAWPEASVTLVETAYRKFCFLTWASARLGLKGLSAVHARVEPVKAGGPRMRAGNASDRVGGPYDAVVARALAPLAEAAGLCLPLAAPGGWCLLYQSGAPDAGDEALSRALEAAGGSLEGTVAYRLPKEAADRHLVVLRKGP